MLSILIPTYNYDCTELVRTLIRQLPEKAEILVGDDCSTEQDIQESLAELATLPAVRVIRPATNLGSAGMRNLLAQEAHGEYLLYIDSDAIVEDERFIGKYLQEADGTVVCGTIRHPDRLPSPRQSLRWKYEKQYERDSQSQRHTASPYQHFRTSHFLIPKKVMLQVPFDEEIKRSGYEDLLFGKRLKEKGIRVKVADIHAMNGDIETNEVYLRKTEGHMQTLLQMKKELEGYSTLLNIYAGIKRIHLLPIVTALFRLTRGWLRHNLLGTNPSMHAFQFYKLGYFALLMENAEKEKRKS